MEKQIDITKASEAELYQFGFEAHQQIEGLKAQLQNAQQVAQAIAQEITRRKQPAREIEDEKAGKADDKKEQSDEIGSERGRDTVHASN
jgi:hypothetical protein